MNQFLEFSVYDKEKWFPSDTSEVISWQGHIPFAFTLIRLLKPACVVELGTYKGDSYLAFCEAAKRYSPQTRCFAIDAWAGDEHTGFYDEEVLTQLRCRHDDRYGNFSELVRSTFDDALARFPDASIDLLHIDGLHTYEAVQHDFETWKGKLSDRGIVLFHDTMVRQADFAVWRYWAELCKQYPNFEFQHSNGLGVLAVGRDAAKLLPDLFHADEKTIDRIRALFSTLGNSVAFEGLNRSLETATAKIRQLNNTLEERQSEISRLNKISQQWHAQLTLLLNSRAWKITAPLRFISAVCCETAGKAKSATLAVMRKVFQRLPVSNFMRSRLKDWFYRYLPGLFSQTLSYHIWKSQQTDSALPKFNECPPKRIGSPLLQEKNGPFEINCPENPVVSIVIPVHGKIEYTYQCLRSLWSHGSRYSFEVIVVDDSSPDNTMEILHSIKGIRVVRNKTNIGFVCSCNAGAKVARGEYLCFLNNDTVVTKGWLDELVRTFLGFPNTGLVGSKLIYPDGRLQEAGGIIRQDGSAWNFGRFRDPLLPAYNYAREVDYCSGASIMVLHSLFREIGGFDERYTPAYYEDCDLAFKIREKGYRVIYQPLSMAIHYEGATSGTNAREGVKAHQVENEKKFFDRWKDQLKSYTAPGVDVESTTNPMMKLRVLALDHSTPTPDQDAGSVIILNLLIILREMGFQVTFIPEDNFLYMPAYTTTLQRLGIEVLHAPYASSVEKHLKKNGDRYDLVLLSRPLVLERNIKIIRKYCPKAKVLFHPVDLHFLRMEREAKLHDDKNRMKQAADMKQREFAIIHKADATIVHSTVELDLLRSEFPDEKIYVFPLAMAVHGTANGFSERRDIVFVGGCQHFPNSDALKFFVREVMPILRKRLQGVRFHVVGKRTSEEIRELACDDVIIAGFVEDLDSFLDKMRISVAPLRYGAGVKGKIIAAMAVGLPVVASSLAAEGMSLVNGENVLLADGAEALADTIAKLYENETLWNKLSRAGLEFAEREWGAETAYRLLADILSDLGLSMRSHSYPLRLYSPLLDAREKSESQPNVNKLRPVFTARNRNEYEQGWRRKEFAEIRALERQFIENSNTETFFVSAFCIPCNKTVSLLVDMFLGGQRIKDNRIPNWRERLVCPLCHMNNRQRLVAALIDQLLERKSGAKVYFMEQVTPIFHWAVTRFPDDEIIGSEYLGHKYQSGQIIKGIRHEDVMNLSFANDSLDLICSNDVFEHIPDPNRAFAECARVLRPGGIMLATIPFHCESNSSVVRASLTASGINHLLPAMFHGNPVSEKGSLVFTSFGWDILEDMKKAGFSDVFLEVYANAEYGHLGEGQIIFKVFK